METMFTPVASPNLWFALKILRYTYPTLVFFYFFIALGITVCYMQAEKSQVQDQYVRRGLILCFIGSLTGTYAVEIIVAIIKSSVENWNPGQDRVVYLISSTLVFLVQIIALGDTKSPTWYPYYGTWFIGLCVELCLIILPNVFSPPPNSAFDYILISIQAIRIFNLIALPIIYLYIRDSDKAPETIDTERQSLLKKPSDPSSSESSTLNGNGYGTTGEPTTQDEEDAGDESDTASVASEDSYLKDQRKSKEAIAKRLKEDGNWWTYLKGFSMFIPFVWPVHHKMLQFRAVLVAITLLASNALNLLVPIQFGIMVQSLINYTGGDHSHNIWTPVLLYSLLRYINGGSCLTVIRTWLWNPLEQYAYKTLSLAAHSHIMNLSSDFHDSKSSSDLFQVVHGGRSVADLMEMVCFQVVPMIIDLVIAFIYFGAFGPYMFLVLVVTFVSYMYATVKLISMRTNQRRDYITFARKEWTTGQESLDGWTTANLFNMVPYENERYSGVIKEHIDSKWAYEWFWYIASMAKSLIMCFGLTGVLCLGAYSVVYEGQTVGKFTTLLMFWGQIQEPLSFLASAYRTISSSLIDAERLLELLKTEPSIKEAPNAKDLEITKCEIEFNDVCFSYDERKPILKNVSFFAPGGKTIAFVGETGGGKSTMLKLMDRFYDVKTGSIKIDGQDIRDITMHSLRSHVGVVPQDPTLFNDTVMNNIRYARLDATDEEVYEACKAAAVHDKIMKFADGYNSKVGDRGVKLSGGEKQRVAIARAILKQPKIILLDEATSAVDTETEQKIQEGFNALCKGRTTFIVAHRLSTVMNADHIVVVMDGQIVEQGSHDKLFHSKGRYADLWAKQIFVKPSDRRSRSKSRSKSPAKTDATLVNDLTSEDKTVTLAKAVKAVKDHNHSKDDGKGADNGTSSTGKSKDESKRKADELNHASLLSKIDSSKLKITNVSKPKFPTSNSEVQIKQQSLGGIPRPTPVHRSATTPQPAIATARPTNTNPHITTSRPSSPQHKNFTTQLIEQTCKAHPPESPPRPPILSQPRSLFSTGNLPVPIHAKNVLDHPNLWGEEQPCRTPSSTHSMLSSQSVLTGVDLKHEKVDSGCKAGNGKSDSGKIEGTVQDKVEKLDKRLPKRLPKGLPRGAMFIQIPKHITNEPVEERQRKPSAAESPGNLTAASELTPLLVSKDSPTHTGPSFSTPKDIIKAQKKQLAKERRKLGSSSHTISEPINAASPAPIIEPSSVQSATAVKVQTKEAAKEQRRRDKEVRKAESLRKKEGSIRRKAEFFLKKHGVGTVIAAGDEDEISGSGTAIVDFAQRGMNTNNVDTNKSETTGFDGFTGGIVESYTDLPDSVQDETTHDITIPTAARLAADAHYPQRDRRIHSKSEPRGNSVSLELDSAGTGSQDTIIIVREGDGESDNGTNSLIRYPSVNRDGVAIGTPRRGERKGILKNFAQEKRRVSAPAREGMDYEGREERKNTDPDGNGGRIDRTGIGGLGFGVPVMPERERGPPVSLGRNMRLGLNGDGDVDVNMQGQGQRENFVSGGRRMYMGGGLMRGKKRQWRIRSRAVESAWKGEWGVDEGWEGVEAGPKVVWEVQVQI
ncbi:putative abc transporter protein [Botrytis fragariae]|uniref:Putative abc transporter protein n=1 Tax=Botrytis fragariae TaxID=1964551 RepID=A0A8H6AH88_9HELO|nr:putative abc transporter protein [Botrytis fragariae]KAF5867462.1 putative abc transporter protein [Botrytis fragariae]